MLESKREKKIGGCCMAGCAVAAGACAPYRGGGFGFVEDVVVFALIDRVAGFKTATPGEGAATFGRGVVLAPEPSAFLTGDVAV